MVISLELEILLLKLNSIRKDLVYNNELLPLVIFEPNEIIKQLDSIIKIANSKPKYYPNMELLVEDYINSREIFASK